MNWLPRLVSSQDLQLPPRPKINRKLRAVCVKCGIVHPTKTELLECLTDTSQP